jgi:hydroxyacylglutathione hydrolase
LEAQAASLVNLKAIVLTHGDFDHSGNASYLGKKFGTKMAMHHAFQPKAIWAA